MIYYKCETSDGKSNRMQQKELNPRLARQGDYLHTLHAGNRGRCVERVGMSHGSFSLSHWLPPSWPACQPIFLLIKGWIKWRYGMRGRSLLDSWVHRGDVPKACLVTGVEHRRGRSLRGIWSRKWPLCELPPLSWKGGGVPGKWKGLTCFRKSYQTLDDRLLRGSPGVSVGQKERWKRGGEVPARGAELHPKVPRSKEECAITIWRGEGAARSKVE